MSLGDYKKFDLLLLAALAIIAEIIAILPFRYFGGTYYFLTLSLTVVLIAVVRWGAIGCLTYLPVIIVRIVLHVAPEVMLDRLVVYLPELILSLLIPLFFQICRIGRAKISSSLPHLSLYVVYSYLLVCLGRFSGLLILGNSLGDSFQNGFTYSLFESCLNLIAILLVGYASKSTIQDVIYQLKGEQK